MYLTSFLLELCSLVTLFLQPPPVSWTTKKQGGRMLVERSLDSFTEEARESSFARVYFASPFGEMRNSN